MNTKRRNSVDVHVAEQIKAGRMASGMSQEKLAKSLGISFQQVQKCETGMNRISAGRLYQIALIIDRPITFFFEGAPKLKTK